MAPGRPTRPSRNNTQNRCPFHHMGLECKSKKSRDTWNTLYRWRWRSSIQYVKTRLGIDCGSDHQLLIAKLRPKLRKVGKSTRSFRYDLNQISNDYRVEVMNRFRGLDLVVREPEELWMEIHNIVQEAVIQTTPKKKKGKIFV